MVYYLTDWLKPERDKAGMKRTHTRLCSMPIKRATLAFISEIFNEIEKLSNLSQEITCLLPETQILR